MLSKMQLGWTRKRGGQEGVCPLLVDVDLPAIDILGPRGDVELAGLSLLDP
jgi:hypothetical protein